MTPEKIKDFALLRKYYEPVAPGIKRLKEEQGGKRTGMSFGDDGATASYLCFGM